MIIMPQSTIYSLQMIIRSLQSTDAKKESTVNSLLPIDEARCNRSTAQDATIYQDAQRCSKMTESLQQINKWINGSTDQQTFGSTGQQ